jgi:hypothetical protein
MPMDMRSAVIVALDIHVAVSVQRRLLPVRDIDVVSGQGLERGFLEGFEALTPGDAKARVAPFVDPLDALGELSVHFGKRGEAPTPVAEAYVAHQDFNEPFDDRLVFRVIRPSRHDGGGVFGGQLCVPRI